MCVASSRVVKVVDERYSYEGRHWFIRASVFSHPSIYLSIWDCSTFRTNIIETLWHLKIMTKITRNQPECFDMDFSALLLSSSHMLFLLPDAVVSRARAHYSWIMTTRNPSTTPPSSSRRINAIVMQVEYHFKLLPFSLKSDATAACDSICLCARVHVRACITDTCPRASCVGAHARDR